MFSAFITLTNGKSLENFSSSFDELSTTIISNSHFVEEIIDEINEDINEYGNTDTVYNPKECDLILCEIIAEMIPMPDYDIEHVNENIPYLECYD